VTIFTYTHSQLVLVSLAFMIRLSPNPFRYDDNDESLELPNSYTISTLQYNFAHSLVLANFITNL